MEEQEAKPLVGAEQAADDFGPDALRAQGALLDAVITETGVVDPDAQASLRQNLARIGSAYLLERFARDYDGDVKKQKAAIGNFIAKLDASLIAMADIYPEYWAAISGMMQDKSQSPPILDPCDVLRRLHDAAAFFLSNYEPRRGPRPNIALEVAVRDLCDLFDDTGIRFTFDSNKHGVGGAKPNSPGAFAAVMLLRGIDSNLPVGTILNMLSKVRIQPQASRSHQDQIWDADPRTALDACLHPRRRDN